MRMPSESLSPMNNSLQQLVTTVEETNNKEIITIRGMYEQELSQVWMMDGRPIKKLTISINYFQLSYHQILFHSMHFIL